MVGPIRPGQSQELRRTIERQEELAAAEGDTLLNALEMDFRNLAEVSDFKDQLLDAERHLDRTTTHSIWDYRNGLKLLREYRDPAAIPLLLRFMVVYADTGNAHISIAHFRETLTILTGHDFPDFYVPGPDSKTKIRELVRRAHEDWWVKERELLTVDTNAMSVDQLRTIANYLIREVKNNGDFTGSGGEVGTAYRTYHNVQYRILRSSSDPQTQTDPIDSRLIPIFLDRFEKSSRNEFPYEAIWILADYAASGSEALIDEVARDVSRDPRIRLACALALHRSGQRFQTRNIVSLLKVAEDLQTRLIILATLRWGDRHLTLPVLLDSLDDPNFEIASIAACALEDLKPPEAIPKIRRLIESAPNKTPLLLYNTIATYKTAEARAVLRDLLTDAVERNQEQKIYRLLSAYADAWNIPRNEYEQSRQQRNYELQARLAMSYADKLKKEMELQRNIQQSLVSSLQEQVDVATAILDLRQKEYRRLLALQGDRVVSASESQMAFEMLNAVTNEVDALTNRLGIEQAKLQSMR